MVATTRALLRRSVSPPLACLGRHARAAAYAHTPHASASCQHTAVYQLVRLPMCTRCSEGASVCIAKAAAGAGCHKQQCQKLVTRVQAVPAPARRVAGRRMAVQRRAKDPETTVRDGATLRSCHLPCTAPAWASGMPHCAHLATCLPPAHCVSLLRFRPA